MTLGIIFFNFHNMITFCRFLQFVNDSAIMTCLGVVYMIQQSIDVQTVSVFIKTVLFCWVMVDMATGVDGYKIEAFGPKHGILGQ